MNSPILQVKNIAKNFQGEHALRNINFHVGPGEMYSIVGPDGAGKTTLIRILCGILKPDKGDVFISGLNLQDDFDLIKKQIGYLSQRFSLYGDLSIDENIEFFADIHGIKNFKPRRDELLESTRLKPFRTRLADKLSGGMKQKLALACAMIHMPKIIFLDEPTTGVDPVSRREFWTLLMEFLKNGVTIVMTTPYLDEAERSRVVSMLDHGEIIAEDSPLELKKIMDSKIVEISGDDIRNVYKILKNEKDTEEVELFGDRINIIYKKCRDPLAKTKKILAAKKFRGFKLKIVSPKLENIFILLSKERKKL